MFPQFLAIVTIYLIFTKITDLYPVIGFNTPWSLVLLYMGGALGVNTWLIKGFFDTVPGSSTSRPRSTARRTRTTFFQIILPLVAPILAVVGLLGVHRRDQRVPDGQRVPDPERDARPSRSASTA